MAKTNLTVNLTVNSDFDAKKIAEKLYTELAKELEIKIEVAKEEAPLKVGEYAKVTKVRNTQAANNGDIIQITEDNRVSIYGYIYRGITLNREDAGVFAPEQLLRVSADEVSEAREQGRWAAIGRKPGEYKQGDIVCDGTDSANFTVLGNSEIRKGAVRFTDNTVNIAQIKLIAPVESRFDFGEGFDD